MPELVSDFVLSSGPAGELLPKVKPESGRSCESPTAIVVRGAGGATGLLNALRRTAAPATDGTPFARRAQGRSFQLLDFRELARCHLLHQVEHGLLFDLADLYELHAGDCTWRRKFDHPLSVGLALQPLD